MLRLYIEDTFCRYIYRLRYDVSDFIHPLFITDDRKHDVGDAFLENVLSGQRQTEIQSQTRVIDGG